MSEHSINDEAATWAVRLDSAHLSAEEQTMLDEWLAASPTRRGALLRAQAVWAHAGTRSIAFNQGSAALATPAPAETLHTAASVRIGYRPISRGLKAAAALLAVVALVQLGHKALEARGDRYTTEVGEVRRIALADGSAITLNSNSSARVRLQTDLRAVQLERGEVLFEVAKSKARPFVVSSGDVAVRAVGTAFAVRAFSGDVVTVIVTEGVVEVSRSQEPVGRVKANERAEIRPNSHFQVRSENTAEATRQLAWREGFLSFSGESLADAVREVNRYSSRQVEISDPALAARPVVGIFRTGDIDAFAQATAAALGAQYQVDGQIIRLQMPPGR